MSCCFTLGGLAPRSLLRYAPWLPAGRDRWLHGGGRSRWGKPFRHVCPKCACLQRLRRAAGCFGEIAASPGTGRGLRFLAGWAANCHWSRPHQHAAVWNRGLGLDGGLFGTGSDSAIASWGVSLLRERPGPARPWTCGPVARAGTTCGIGGFVCRQVRAYFGPTCPKALPPHQPPPSGSVRPAIVGGPAPEGRSFVSVNAAMSDVVTCQP